MGAEDWPKAGALHGRSGRCAGPPSPGWSSLLTWGLTVFPLAPRGDQGGVIRHQPRLPTKESEQEVILTPGIKLMVPQAGGSACPH